MPQGETDFKPVEKRAFLRGDQDRPVAGRSWCLYVGKVFGAG